MKTLGPLNAETGSTVVNLSDYELEQYGGSLVLRLDKIDLKSAIDYYSNITFTFDKTNNSKCEFAIVFEYSNGNYSVIKYNGSPIQFPADITTTQIYLVIVCEEQPNNDTITFTYVPEN